MEPVRVLFVDDDPSIRETLPTTLRMQDFDVTSVGTVADALVEIKSAQFDVSNFGLEHRPSRRWIHRRERYAQDATELCDSYPDRAPRLETALEAIRNQVDGYLIKPAVIPALVSLIEQKLTNRESGAGAATKRIAQILRDNSFEITQQALKEMKADPLLESLRYLMTSD